MKRVFAFGSAVALVIITACVDDQPVDLNARPDAGASPEGGSEGGSVNGSSPNGNGLLCGLLTENPFPSCPGAGPGDPGCSDDEKTACCPGLGCVKNDGATACPAPSPAAPFQCFAGEHCNDSATGFTNRCCARGKLVEDPKRNGCDVPQRVQMEAAANTFCALHCADDAVQICRLGDSRDQCPDKTTCQRTIIAIPNPNGPEPFLRTVGACR